MPDLTIKTRRYGTPEDGYGIIEEHHVWTNFRDEYIEYERIVRHKKTKEVFGFYYTCSGKDVHIIKEEDGWYIRKLYPIKQKLIYTIDNGENCNED